jgi:hypothetical protein
MSPNSDWDNPYSAPDAATIHSAGVDGTRVASNATLITVYAVLNFVWAIGCLIWTGLVVALMVYGIFYSGDPVNEIVVGVAGAFVVGLPAFLGLFVFSIAGFGLFRRSRWGYYAHIVGAALMACSCVGIVYTILAIIHALQPGFRRAFP